MTELFEMFRPLFKELAKEVVHEYIKEKPSEEKYFPERMNQKQACEYLDMSTNYLYQLTAKNEIAFYKKGNRNFFKKSELDEWMESKRVRPVSEYNT
jgi:excisionase family DNA binding protein